MITNLKDYKTELQSISNKALALFKDTENETLLQTMHSEVEFQLQKYSPSIMFYGVYNAGKSSLINALTGSDTALVGDVPTTATIHSIPWNGFSLIDTPGIVANDEHTQIAESEIKRSDIILFVVDDFGTFENIAVSSAIVKIIQTGKPILVVINQKDASIEGAYSNKIKTEVMPKIIENIKNAAKLLGYNGDPIVASNFLKILSVNAKSAFLAKTSYEPNSENYNLLINLSGIENLISIIQEQLNKSQGINMLKPCISIMKDCFTEVINSIESKLMDGNNNDYVTLIRNINEQKSTLYKNIVTLGRNETNTFSDKIFNNISKGENIDALISTLNDNLNQLIIREFSSASIELTNELNIHKIDITSTINNMNSKLDLPELEIATTTSSQDILSPLIENLLDPMKDTLNKFPIDKLPYKINTTIPNPITPIAMLPPAPPIIKFIPMILGGICELVKIKNNREEEANAIQNKIDSYNAEVQNMINQKISNIMECNTKIRTELSRLEGSFLSSVEDNITIAFNSIIANVEKECEESKSLNIELNETLSQVKSLLQRTDNISYTIQ
ncbi:MAG: GTPase [Clostridium sp.]